MNILENKPTISHDELIRGIFAETIKADRKKYTDLFLASLSTNNPSMRSGLAALAITKSFPDHNFTFREQQNHSDISPCRYCSGLQTKKLNIELTKETFETLGGLASFDLADIYCFLYFTNNMENHQPVKKDLQVFSEIINIIQSAKEDETLKKDVMSKINKIENFKSNAQQRQALLETLGYCSILETETHKGLLYEYTNPAVAPRKTHSSDWNYPADWWTGKYGINKKAFEFWFGSYPMLKKIL